MTEQVLLVEDNERSRKLARAVLEMGGMSVTQAATGQEAIDLARTHRFDAVLLDVQLPDIDGVGVVQALRSDGYGYGDGYGDSDTIIDLTGLTFIACTAFAMSGDRERLLDAGFDGYLTKPLDIATLVDDIRAIVAASATRPGAATATRPSAATASPTKEDR